MSHYSTFLVWSLFSLIPLCGIYFLVKKWRKFHTFKFGNVLKVCYGLLLLLFVGFTWLFACISFENYWENDRVMVITQLEKVQLGWSKDDLYFHKGEPITTNEAEDKSQFLIYGATIVQIDEGKVKRVIFDCEADEYGSYVSVGGVSCNDSLERIKELYGDSINYTPSYDKLWRSYNIPKYNLGYVLTQSQVKFLSVFDPKYAPNGYVFKRVKPEEKVKPMQGKIGEVTQSEKTQKVTSEDNDHCAPDITKSERLRRLALKGTVRETGFNMYVAEGYKINFMSDGSLFSCD